MKVLNIHARLKALLTPREKLQILYKKQELLRIAVINSFFEFYLQIYLKLYIGSNITRLRVPLNHIVFFRIIICIILPIPIVELNPLSNRIRKFLYFALTFCIFIHTCKIGE